MENYTAKKLLAEMEKADKAFWKIFDEFIKVGRGMDKPSEIIGRTDPLSIRYAESFDLNAALESEHSLRMDHHGSPKPIKQ